MICKMFICIEIDIGKGSAESNLLATICNYPKNSTPGLFPYLTEILDNFEVTFIVFYFFLYY